ncbi:hypothetical protein HPB50_019021 [Hyalomma asiaticum]|uniref:Uncharacterized protein n=1 Tax=Hyalomma asiaticum TaxID=266040 RepID=A0ACB7T5Q5_HYAAI|nr:hypothetical protein HPB50_019021 [Hyalomma asiaticum]
MRRRYQRAGDESMRSLWRREYNAALARFRRRIGEARVSYERECHSVCSRGTRSAALLLRTQIAVDNAQEDTPENAAVRSLAEEPYMPCNEDVPSPRRSARELVPPSPQFLEGPLGGIYFQCREIEAYPSLGSPQGSPLSPMLWNVTIHDLLGLPLPTGVTVQAYAYDTVIVVPRRPGTVWPSWAPVYSGREKAGITVSKIAALAQMQGGRYDPSRRPPCTAMFLPGVTYASPVWWDKTRPDCRLLSRVVSIQRATLLGLLGAHRTPPHRSGHRSR